MKVKIHFLLICFVYLFGCSKENPTLFSTEALNDTFVELNGNEISLDEILDKHKGDKILIDIWASWCRDCVEGLPDIKRLQKEKEHIKFVFLSLDRSVTSWKKGIVNYQIEGEHYYMQSGWDGPFAEFVDLDWIPRYMVIDENQKIKLYKAIRAKDIKIREILK